jgi:poly-beta-hydroxyalkanoate depolymerase
MLYHHYEMQRLAMGPMRIFATNALSILDLPINPLRQTPFGRVTAAMLDSFEHSTRRFGKPRFGLTSTKIDGVEVPIVEEVIAADAWSTTTSTPSSRRSACSGRRRTCSPSVSRRCRCWRRSP